MSKFRVWRESGCEPMYVFTGDTAIRSDGVLMERYGWSDEFKPTDRNNLTVELCTGIKDKNGLYIYEGNIVRQTLQDHDFMRYFPNGILLEVKLGIFEEDELVPQFYLTEYGGEDVEHERETFMDFYEYEVVGNIHQGVIK